MSKVICDKTHPLNNFHYMPSVDKVFVSVFSFSYKKNSTSSANSLTVIISVRKIIVCIQLCGAN